MSRLLAAAVLCCSAFVAAAPPEPPSTWAMFGGSPGRNMANLTDRGIPDSFDPEKDALWTADLGSRCVTQPVVAGGKVYVGTNNEQPRNPRDTRKDAAGEVDSIDRGVLMCFDAKTGKFLWQAVHDKMPSGRINDCPGLGICSTPCVEGDRVHYVSNRGELVCADADGFADGNQGFQGEKYKDATDADILWVLDMPKQLGVHVHMYSGSSPLVVGDLVFVVTGNGVDAGHLDIPAPDAPSFVAVDKLTGKVAWSDNSPGKAIMHGQWASPAFAAEPTPQVIFPGGDGWLRAFEPKTGKLLWKFDGNPKDAKHKLGGEGNKSDFMAAPVVVGCRLYIGTGEDPEHSTGPASFWCLDLKRAVESGAKNPNADVSPGTASTALAWRYGGAEARKWAARSFRFGRTMSTATVVDDVVYIPELTGHVHCLDAKTGKPFWTFDAKASIWGAAYFADGKVFVGTDGGDLFVLRHTPKPDTIDESDIQAQTGAEAKKWKQAKRDQLAATVLMKKMEFDNSIHSPPTVAGGVLFVATRKTLYAFGRK